MREIEYIAWHTEKRVMLFPGDKYGTTKPLDCAVYAATGQPVILLEYTDKRDRNGKKIYDGCIVRYTDIYDPERSGIGVIHWHDCAWCYLGDNYHGILHLMSMQQLEVIGNVYENPELIQEDKR